MATDFNDNDYYPDRFGGTGPTDNLGYYRYATLTDLINNFMFAKTGEGTLLGKTNRNKVAYHAQRVIQELNYDVLRVQKTQEIEVNRDLRSISLPQDLVHIVGLSFLDEGGTRHPINESRMVSGGQAALQDEDYKFLFDGDGNLLEGVPTESIKRYQNPESDDNLSLGDQAYFYGAGFNDYEFPYSGGYFKRYGLNPETANRNGSYVLNSEEGVIYLDDNFSAQFFASDLFIHLDYISDGLASEEADIKVNKLVEEAFYKMVEYMMLSNKAEVPDFTLRRVKKEADTVSRNSKIRLMNLNLNELAQVFRIQNKWIKH